MTISVSEYANGLPLPSIHSPEINIQSVPLITANEESFRAYGRIVKDYEDEKVIIETWPALGWRQVKKGTGNEGGISEGDFIMYRDGECMVAYNHAVDGHYITGWFTDPQSAVLQQSLPSESLLNSDTEPPQIYVREANYHPDGGQVFFPKNKNPFVALLALPGDDVCPQDFVAFYCDGTFGIQIFPNVWHQPVFPVDQEGIFKDKQGKVHACVDVDFITEFSTYLAVPLRAPTSFDPS